jgi:UDP-2-acetamido-3-amino-2,3-dideoxy-glucuronate N-acetyltransferase
MDDSAAVLEGVDHGPHAEREEYNTEQSEPAGGICCHETACVEQPSKIGPGTRVGPYAHVKAGAIVGAGCQIGRNVVVAPTAVVGDGVVIGSGVTVEDGVALGDGVYCGPGVVFAPVMHARSERAKSASPPPKLPAPVRAGGALPLKPPEAAPDSPRPIVVQEGATLEANATVFGGTTIGVCAVVTAGSVVRGDVPGYAVMTGVPASRTGWLCRCGRRELDFCSNLQTRCPICGRCYQYAGKAGAKEYSPEEERRSRKADLYEAERRYVASITPATVSRSH